MNCTFLPAMTKETYARAYQDGFPITFRFLLSRGVARDTAEEISQAAWMRGWERLGQLRSEELVSTWVNTIALNLYRRAICQERRLQVLRDPMYAKSTMNFAAIELRRVLRFCRLPDRQLLEAQMAGQTAEEIAQDQGVSQTAIRIRLLRARRAARQAAENVRVRRKAHAAAAARFHSAAA